MQDWRAAKGQRVGSAPLRPGWGIGGAVSIRGQWSRASEAIVAPLAADFNNGSRPIHGDQHLVTAPRRGVHEARARRRATTFGRAATKASMSSSVVGQPTETRSERSASTPMACSTGEGSRDSEEQAEPE